MTHIKWHQTQILAKAIAKAIATATAVAAEAHAKIIDMQK
jgi:hypothetical protein